MSVTMVSLTESQDLLTIGLEGIVSTFLDENPGVTVNYCNIQVNKSPEGVTSVNASTSVDTTIDGARITRVVPRGTV